MTKEGKLMKMCRGRKERRQEGEREGGRFTESEEWRSIKKNWVLSKMYR